ncbi:MAG: heme-binding protein [Kineosporiaceae bacterium]|nr:heme-binding protein [Kineosporiaceae bacterium]
MDVRSVPTISYAAALRVVAAAVNHAEGMGVPVNVAVADPGGHLVAFARMDGAAFFSSSVAQDKAWSVAAFNGLPTHAWIDMIKDEPSLLHGLPPRPRLTIFGGGVPLTVDGQVVGAVGVSGGSEAEDLQIAEAGAGALS